MSTFGERLEKARKDQGFSRKGLADRMEEISRKKYRQHTLYRYEKGQVEPGLFVTVLIARALGVSLGWLAGELSDDAGSSPEVVSDGGQDDLGGAGGILGGGVEDVGEG